jgi:hypothetical protein
MINKLKCKYWFLIYWDCPESHFFIKNSQNILFFQYFNKFLTKFIKTLKNKIFWEFFIKKCDSGQSLNTSSWR